MPQLNRKLARTILERDKYSCQHCGESDLAPRFRHVHHLDGSGHDAHPNNDPSNLVTLCARCHTHLHRFGHPFIAYGYRCANCGDRRPGEGWQQRLPVHTGDNSKRRGPFNHH